MRASTIQASTTITMALPTSISISDRLNALLREAATVTVSTTHLRKAHQRTATNAHLPTAGPTDEGSRRGSATDIKGRAGYVR